MEIVECAISDIQYCDENLPVWECGTQWPGLSATPPNRKVLVTTLYFTARAFYYFHRPDSLCWPPSLLDPPSPTPKQTLIQMQIGRRQRAADQKDDEYAGN